MANETAKTVTRRLYVLKKVNAETPSTKRLIRATSQAAALRHATAGLYHVAPATPEDVAQLYADGVRAEDAS